MRELLRDVMVLQAEWVSENTPAMRARGELIRRDLPALLRERLPALQRAAAVEITDWRAAGSDGAGNRAEIPWARVHSAGRSPRATEGWYVVYLFAAPGDRVYLSLMQASSSKKNREYKRLPGAGLRQRALEMREALSARLRARPDLVAEIALKATRSELGQAYEDGTVVAFEYPLDDLPSDEVLADDLTFLVSVLSELYELLDRGTTAPEITDAEVEVERLAGKARKGQGLLQSAADRIAIERRAVDVATRYLEEQGYDVEDVGAKESYDLDARRADEHLYVEVKGTTTTWTDASEIILTRQEVELHLREHPNTMLVIVSGIALDRAVSPPTASGGTLRVIHPWAVKKPNLTPMSYRYVVGE
ncbi:MrcB family domain-containing protein [Lentzea sp. NPDC058436]|uniref:MrcB family domain-containing protein n=1 Tax=Lentzea sp. NPDC058436 TaxID=3346499 RepID=UPI00365E7888